QSGAAYLPLDAAWPTRRLHHILHRTDCRTVLTQSALAESLDWPEGITVLAVDDDRTWAAASDTPPEAVAGPDDLAYTIFTSGSTGEPKGVMIGHQAAANTVTDINTRYHLGPDDRVLGLSSLSFDLSVWDLFGTLAAGATLVLPGADEGRDPAAWLETMERNRVSVWNSVPALMDMLTEHALPRNTTLPALRLVLLSGDWIPLTLPPRIHTLAPHSQQISLGGATEAAIWSIHHPIPENPDPTWTSIPYGKPLTNQTLHILDTHGNPTPTWTTGHLHIAGKGLAHGYWKNPHHPQFHTHPTTGQRLYNTGDLARYHPDGTIEFLGRTDHQIKLHGHRIELGEIHHHLTT
ncbi:amino acid adenylation domain-containing protein, partial [Streptomyces sp. JJ36]|uniref:amino acid adenylation domain-containing protein n=1 Tax=Streptomyces sp. JJ36 TaxID=2736645 RepID=UPI001F441235